MLIAAILSVGLHQHVPMVDPPLETNNMHHFCVLYRYKMAIMVEGQ